MSVDLFGNETREPRASLRPLPPPVKLDLFSAAAEQLAIGTGRALSQERAEIVAPAGTSQVAARGIAGPITEESA